MGSGSSVWSCSCWSAVILRAAVVAGPGEGPVVVQVAGEASGRLLELGILLVTLKINSQWGLWADARVVGPTKVGSWVGCSMLDLELCPGVGVAAATNTGVV